MDAIFQPLYFVFGYVMRFLFDLFSSYGVAVILFTILLRAALIPLGVNQYKNTAKQQGMTEELNDLKRRYGTDKEKMQQAQMELYQKHGFNPLSGCLPSILQLVIIWPVYRIISAPLIHMMGVAKEAIGTASIDKATGLIAESSSGIAKILFQMKLITETQAQQAEMFNLPVIEALRTSAEAMSQAVSAGFIKAEQLLSLNFLGMNLGLIPTYDTSKLFGAEIGTWLPLMVIPILAVVTTWLSMKVSQSTMPNAKSKKDKEEAERANRNPAKKGQAGGSEPDPSAGMMKGMQYFMPIFTLWISFTTPAALGLYWIINNIMSMVQQYILYNIVTKKTQKALPAAAAATDKTPPATKG